MSEVLSDLGEKDRIKSTDSWWQMIAGRSSKVKSDHFTNICENNHIFMYTLICCMNSTVC